MRSFTWQALARAVLVAVDGFVAVTAIGGGLGLASGLEGARFPVGWLVGTPFDSYLLPGLLLAVVGGIAAVGTVLTVREARTGGRASVIAGAVLAAWIVGEIVVLTNDGELVSPTEVVYLGAAAAMVALGLVVGQAPRIPGA